MDGPGPRPDLKVSNDRFELWKYERHLVIKGVPLLALVLLLAAVEVLVLDGPSVRFMGWVLAILFAGPLMIYAMGKTIDRGRKVLSWYSPWHATAWMRRWFRAQYGTVYIVLALVSFHIGSIFLSVGFLIYLGVFMAVSWAFESRASITTKGVSTRIGVLTWDAIKGITVYPEDGILVLEVSSLMRHYMPFALYWVPDPIRIATSIRELTWQAGEGPVDRDRPPRTTKNP